METGGFDAIVGNPPYVTLEIEDKSRNYYKVKYPESSVGKINTYRLFLHKSIILLRNFGLLGYIIPNTYLTDRDSVNIRELIFKFTEIREIHYFPEKAKVFSNVTQATTILILSKNLKPNKNGIIKINNSICNANDLLNKEFKNYHASDFMDLPEKMIVINRTYEQLKIITRLMEVNKRIENILDVYQGEANVSINKKIIHINKISNKCMPLIRGNNIGRYFIDLSFNDSKGSWIIVNKNDFRGHFKIERIVTQEVSNMQQNRRLNGMPLKSNIIVGHTANYLILRNDEYSLLFIVGLLNSFLLDFIFKTFNSTNHIPARELKRLPVPKINFQNEIEKKSHDKIVLLVEQMLEAKKQLHGSKTEKDKIYFERKCESLDKQIDAEVYKLYGLTEDEIKIVEGE